MPPGRIRRPGAGRKKLITHDPRLPAALDRLIDPETRGDPESPLRWICKSTRTLAAQLTRQKHPISYVKVGATVERAGLQPAKQPQDGRRRGPSRPRRAIPSHQHASPAGFGPRDARDLRGHQEEGTAGKLREQRPAMAVREATPEGERSRFPRPDVPARTRMESMMWTATRAS